MKPFKEKLAFISLGVVVGYYASKVTLNLFHIGKWIALGMLIGIPIGVKYSESIVSWFLSFSTGS